MILTNALYIKYMIEDLITIFSRDLDRLKTEIETFQEESNLWITAGNITNTAGNLCLHLMGNVNTYIGKNIGQYHYIRNREAEFSLKGVSRQKMIEDLEKTKTIVLSTLQHMEKEKLDDIYIENVLGYEMTYRYFLIHLTAHFSYHLGQINYLRRILEF